MLLHEVVGQEGPRSLCRAHGWVGGVERQPAPTYTLSAAISEPAPVSAQLHAPAPLRVLPVQTEVSGDYACPSSHSGGQLSPRLSQGGRYILQLPPGSEGRTEAQEACARPHSAGPTVPPPDNKAFSASVSCSLPHSTTSASWAHPLKKLFASKSCSGLGSRVPQPKLDGTGNPNN